jgi:diguanylate cyclase
LGASEFTSVNPRLMQTILRYMDGLRRSLEGEELYGLIARILRRHGRSGPVGDACFVDLHSQLGVYASDPVSLPANRIKARLLQQHILPYLPDPTLATEAEIVADVTVPADDSADVAIEGTLAARPTPLKAQRERVEALQRSEQDAWNAIYKVVNDFSSLKDLWSEGFDEIALDQQRFAQKLGAAEQTLQSVESNCQQLRAELASAQRAPARKVPRRVTRLPRSAAVRLVSRDAFLQQLQAEVSRVKRTGGATTLAMMGVRQLDAIAEQFGDGANSAVLGCYAREILSGFRAYDVIGRYDEHVFSVLLPDTGREGAVRALEKAQKRAHDTHVNHDGRRFPLPGFCGALSAYNPGEDLAAWLQRTESAIEGAAGEDKTDLIVT